MLPETVSAAADVSARLVIPEVVRVVAVVSAKVLVPDTVSSSDEVEPKVADPAFNVLALAAASVVVPVTTNDSVRVDAWVEWPETSKLAALVAASFVVPEVVRVVAVAPAKVVVPDTVSELAWAVLKLATLVAPNKIRFPSASVRFPVRRWVEPRVLAPVTVRADAVVLARAVAPETDSDVARVVLKLATLVAPGCILSVTLNNVSTPVALHQTVRSAHGINLNVKMRHLV